MAKANILKTPSYKASLGRSGHDLSRRILFTSSVGQLLPVLYDFLSPGDKVRLNDRLFTRTQPLKSAAFVRVTEHIYYFFVPMDLIDGYFRDQFTGMQDVVSSRMVLPIGRQSDDPVSGQQGYGYNMPVSRPFMKFQDLNRALLGLTSISDPIPDVLYYSIDGLVANLALIFKDGYANFFDQYGIPKMWNAMRLLDLLGYGNFYNQGTSQPANFSNFGLSFDLLLCYQRIYMDYFRLSKFEPMNVWACNKDGYYAIATNHQSGIISDAGSDFYDVDFGNIATSTYNGLLKLRYHPIKKDFFTNIETTPLFDVFNVGGYGYGLPGNPYSNAFGDSKIGLDDVNSAILSSYGVQLQQQSADYTKPNDYGVPPQGNQFGQSFSSSFVNTALYPDEKFANLQSLRLAYAYERMLAITQRAGRHYEDQILAHFGVKVPQGIGREVYYLGAHSSRLAIGEVVATATSSAGEGENSVLGEIAGRGLGSSDGNKDIKFTAPCHGYLMAIYSAVPDIDYKGYGLDRINTYVGINSFPHPEFDNIGMQPLYTFQSNLQDETTQINDNLVSPASFLGWQYRWSELKLSFDRVYGAFNHTLTDWTSSIFFGQLYFGDLNNKYNMQFWDNFYVPPTYLDNIFALSFAPPVESFTLVEGGSLSGVLLSSYSDGSSQGDSTGGYKNLPGVYMCPLGTSVCYQRDPLLHSIDFKYYKTSFMSTYGLPKL